MRTYKHTILGVSVCVCEAFTCEYGACLPTAFSSLEIHCEEKHTCKPGPEVRSPRTMREARYSTDVGIHTSLNRMSAKL